MEIFTTKKELEAYLLQKRALQKIGLVPTMGALHPGHLSLIDEAKKSADLVVCSIFVNPTQFNDSKDLEKYPRPIEHDIALLESARCDVLFLPAVEEMYPDPAEVWHIDLGGLDQIWEGEYRPGHFQGVTQVVYKLFRIVQPDIACFGQKDFQQVMVIQRMLDVTGLTVRLVVCPIIRDENGLALSSRNARLSEDGRKKALVLSRALQLVKQDFPCKPVDALKQAGTAMIQNAEGVELEYFAICERSSLREVKAVSPDENYVAIVAAWVEGVRLIDNMLM